MPPIVQRLINDSKKKKYENFVLLDNLDYKRIFFIYISLNYLFMYLLFPVQGVTWKNW